MTQAICGVNASCYQPSSEPEASSGGASGNPMNGAHGAGNIPKTGEPEASLRCLPQLITAVKDCASAALVRSVTGALICGVRLEALRECLTAEPSGPKRPES